MSIVVPGSGRTPNDWMIVGEAPGREEAARGEPFVGKSGQEQAAYLARYDLRPWHAYLTNVHKMYAEGNPDPTPDDIAFWTPVLLDELATVQPRVIFAVGRFAMRWFLGEGADLDTCHGLPHRAGAFDPGRTDRGGPNDAFIIPIHHPALGFYDGDARSLIAWDYGQAAGVLHRALKGSGIVGVRTDLHEGIETYMDVHGSELVSALLLDSPRVIAVDTEGSPSDPWSIQLSWIEGTGIVLRTSHADFEYGIRELQRVFDDGALCVLHNGMFDIEMCRAMGLDLSRARLYDTMYAAYLMRLEPQGLKPLAWRWAGMRMRDYLDTVGDAGRGKQIAYLESLIEIGEHLPKPEPREIALNNGTFKLYKPRWIVKGAEKWIEEGRAEGSDIDLEKRWRAVDDVQRRYVESILGPFPEGTLADIPLDAAVWYSARDADATLRVYNAIDPQIRALDLTRTMADGMSVLPVFEEIQATGMYASLSRFEKLEGEVNDEMGRIQSRLSVEYYGCEPFNPASSDQTARLMQSRGLVGEKLTTTGKPSTGKKSIEHLRFSDPAIALVIDWREHQKIRDAFCLPAIERGRALMNGDGDLFPMRCQIKTTRVASRRLAAANPNLLQIPARHALGQAVRKCYVAPPGQLYGAWDLSQIEMRYMAHESNDPLLCELFRTGRDVHTETAAAVFKLPLDQVDKMRHRYPAKRAGFGILYGISGAGLYDQLRMMNESAIDDWSVEQCDDLIAAWLDLYSGVREYIARTGNDVAGTGLVRDHWGMMRYLPGAWSRDDRVRAEAAREAVSHRIQGGAQGMIQRSMAWLRDRIWELRDSGCNIHWSLQIHDEIILRFDERWAPVIDPLVHEALTRHHGMPAFRVPVEASGGVADTWAGLK